MFKYIDTPKLVACYLREFALEKENKASLLYKFILCVVLPFVSQRFRRARLIALAIAECTQSQDQIVRVLKKIVAFETGLREDDVKIDVTAGDEHCYMSYDGSNDANQQTSYSGEDDLLAPYAEVQNIVTFTVYDEAVLQIVNKYIALLVPFYVAYEVVLYSEPMMQFTIVVDRYVLEPQYNVDGGTTYDLAVGTNVLDIPESFSEINIITDANYSTILLKTPNGQYIAATSRSTYTFKRSENPDVTTLALYDAEGIEYGSVLSFMLMPSGQGDIEYEVTTYPSGDVLASFTDEAGVAQLITLPEEADTEVLEIYGYDYRANAPHTPKLLTNPDIEGTDGYTSIMGDTLRKIKGKTVTIE